MLKNLRESTGFFEVDAPGLLVVCCIRGFTHGFVELFISFLKDNV
jgi:hypothetical protein